MKIFLPVVSSFFLAACSTSATFYNPNISDPVALERQRIIDEGYCTQAAAGAVPLPQVRYYQSGIQSYQINGNIQSLNTNGNYTSSNYTGNVTSYTNSSDAFSAGFANGINMGAAIRAKNDRDAVFQGCMYSLGWSTDKNATATNAPLPSNQHGDEDVIYFTLFLKKAEAGDVSAQETVAAAYEAGIGTATDIDKAIYWATKASEQGQASASFQLSVIYVGQDHPKYSDPEKAQYYLLKSAEQGFPVAQRILGTFYLEGNTYFKKDYSKAIHWLSSACQNKDIQSCEAFGVMLGTGSGTPQDLVTAHRVFSYAKNLGSKNADELIKTTESKMTKTQLKEVNGN